MTEKVIHALIECERCHAECIQYLNGPKVSEVIHDTNGLPIDVCLACLKKEYPEEESIN